MLHLPPASVRAHYYDCASARDCGAHDNDSSCVCVFKTGARLVMTGPARTPAMVCKPRRRRTTGSQSGQSGARLLATLFALQQTYKDYTIQVSRGGGARLLATLFELHLGERLQPPRVLHRRQPAAPRPRPQTGPRPAHALKRTLAARRPRPQTGPRCTAPRPATQLRRVSRSLHTRCRPGPAWHILSATMCAASNRIQAAPGPRRGFEFC